MEKMKVLRLFVSNNFVLVLFNLLVILNMAKSDQCPDNCVCKWKGNKETVECIGNALKSIPSGISQGTQVLNLAQNNIQVLRENAFLIYGLVNLQRIFLNNCQIGEIHEGAFTQLTNLVELDLSHNLLTHIPSNTFKNTPALRELELRHNYINFIPENAFYNTPSLTHLDLSHCNITKIDPKAFSTLSLELLEIQSNKLKELPYNVIKSLNNTHTIKLHENQWVCDCRALPLFKLLYLKRPPVSPICYHPQRVRQKSFEDLDESQFACPPKIVRSNTLISSAAGENATLTCRAEGQPKPKVSWFINGVPISNGSVLGLGPQRTYIMQERTSNGNSHLIVTRAQEENSGVFTCFADNPAGQASENYTLKITMAALSPSSFHSGHIAAISVGAVIFGIVFIIVALLVFARSKSNSSPTPAKNVRHISSPAEPNPVQKPPRLTDLSSSTSTDPDLISEAEKSSRQINGHIPNGKVNHGNMTENGDYTRMEGDSLYPSGLWDGEPPSGHEHFNPGYVAQDSPLHNHNLQGNVHSAPYKPEDPHIYGYPSDYGLPIPDTYSESLYSSRQELQSSVQSGSNRHSLYSSGQDLFGSKQDMYCSKNELIGQMGNHTSQREDINPYTEIYRHPHQGTYDSPQRKPLSPAKNPQDIYSPFHQQKQSVLYRVEEDPDIRDADIAEGAESSPIHDPPGERPWVPGCQGSPAPVPMGVQVLPPLPTGGLHRIKPRDSPDEGYQEGTDV